MRALLLPLCLLLAAPALAQTAHLPQVRSADGAILDRARPEQLVDDGGVPIDPRAPLPATSTPSAVTLGAADAFQQVLTASPARRGCLIQNKSATAVVHVFLGLFGAATSAKSIDLAPGETFNCSTSNLVLTDAIAVSASVLASPIVVVVQ